ncbi:MAG TPA: inorganic diphosphatase [Anaeromyxobacteraceae bacterium]|nr:inorganic diphosphatase [Anaeromyxobacteraceae bacterium]
MDLRRLPARDGDGSINVVVESPRGATVKLKYEPSLGAMTVARALPLGLAYPYDWGFVPGTCAADGDPLDALIVWDAASFPGTVVRCRAVGVVLLEQDRKGGGGRIRNDRLILLPVKYDRGAPVHDLCDLPERLRDEIAQFLLVTVVFGKKNPRVLGWGGASEAEALVERSCDSSEPQPEPEPVVRAPVARARRARAR